MTRYWLSAAALLAALALAGCGRGPRITPVDTDTHLGESISIDLADWLGKPRAELARLAQEYEETLTKQHTAHGDAASEQLLPKLSPPRTIPVFSHAKYSRAAGFSLPEYVGEGSQDAAVALHLARFGDHEAALKLADPANANLRRAIEALRGEKNYPVEWSRLVGLALLSAQYKLAVAGDPEGATELVLLHQQLTKLLDRQTAAGPLGAALLSGGRRALVQASRNYRSPGWKKNALADDIEKALADWGPLPAGRPALEVGAGKVEALALFGTPVRGKALLAVAPAERRRVLDLLALPLPTAGVQSVAAFLDANDRVSELAVVYRGKLETAYPESDHLAFHLDERGLTGKEDARPAALVRQVFTVDGLGYEVNRCNRSPGIGALVRIVAGKGAGDAAPQASLRAFGPVSLDRGFEANRLSWAPNRTGPALMVEDRTALTGLVGSLGLPTPAAAALQRDRDHDVVASLRLTWSPDLNAEAAGNLLPLFFALYGPSALEGVENSSSAHLHLRWEDERTRAELQLPHDDHAPLLIVEDRYPAERRAERARLVHQADENERQARLKEGKALRRLKRTPGQVNDMPLDNLHLGQGRTEALASLPHGRGYRLKTVPGGVSLLNTNVPQPGDVFWARQVLVRFDSQDKVSEIRVRYQEGLAPAKKGAALLDRLNAAPAAQPEALSAPWAGLWADLPAPGPRPTLLRWQDDFTIRTYQRDATHSEVVWRERQAGVQPPWRFVHQGPAGCSLGDTKEQVEQVLKAPAAASGGASVYRQKKSSPYEMLMVWYTGGRASRIVAVHRKRTRTDANELATALQQAWARDLDALGAVSRQDGRHRSVLGSYFWHDDRTRVQTFVQQEDQTGRVLTEWREWPVPTDQLASK
jgi:hypothetical protein